MGGKTSRRWLRLLITRCFVLVTFLLISCSQPLPATIKNESIQIQINADGETVQFTTNTATSVREVLAEAAIPIDDVDEVTPPLFTPIMIDEGGLTIIIVRVTESVEVIPRNLPFERKLVRNEAMSADDPPRIIQTGQDGLQEETVRIVYRDGLEAERWVTQIATIEPAQDEIVMVGIGAAQGNVNFEGILAYISSGNSVLMRGLSAFPETLKTGAGLDGRVFSLSPDGSHLLYTRIITDTASFSNNLWLINTERGAEPWSLEVENVLWADWEPASTDPPRIAYSTANPTNLPPGWEANNDLWLGEVSLKPEDPFEPEQLVEAYPATYGWWGGNYAWSPQGVLIGFSFANEVGVIDTSTEEVEFQRRQLQLFTEYNTRSDWVWVPTLTWSPDGRFLAFTQHSGDDPETLTFDSWVVDVETGVSGRFIERSGMWAHMHWNSAILEDGTEPVDDQIAFLKAIDPLDNQRGSYTLWLMDQDGSNGRRIYPPAGELSFFPRDHNFMVWGPDGRSLAFIFDDALYLMNLEVVDDAGLPQVNRLTQDDALVSHPTWSISGPPVEETAPIPSADDDFPTPLRGSPDRSLPDE